MNPNNPKQMVVEGYDDLYSVVGVMRAHVDWPDPPADPPVYIKIGKSSNEILERGYLDGLLKGNVVQMLGVMLDADTNPIGRYQSIRSLCSSFFPKMPMEMSPNGLIIENEKKKKLGVWIMPDNASPGCVETFLRFLVPSRTEPIWTHSIKATDEAKKIGCDCRDSHIDKAYLYTWLAWQDPPGQDPGKALVAKILDPKAGHCAAFARWFTELYGLGPKSDLFS